MKVTYTRAIYETFEVDIPLQEIEEKYQGYVKDAIPDYITKSVKVDEEVEIEDVEIGRLSKEDEDREELQYLQELEGVSITTCQYYQGLGI